MLCPLSLQSPRGESLTQISMKVSTLREWHQEKVHLSYHKHTSHNLLFPSLCGGTFNRSFTYCLPLNTGGRMRDATEISFICWKKITTTCVESLSASNIHSSSLQLLSYNKHTSAWEKHLSMQIVKALNPLYAFFSRLCVYIYTHTQISSDHIL